MKRLIKIVVAASVVYAVAQVAGYYLDDEGREPHIRGNQTPHDHIKMLKEAVSS